MSKISYANAVGNIMYVILCTHPNISQSVNLVSRYMTNTWNKHWKIIKWIVRYLKGDSDVGLAFLKSDDILVFSYVYSKYAEDLDRIRSINEYIFILIVSVISYKSTLQSIVTLSIIEVEYMAAAVKRVIGSKSSVEELSLVQLE